MPPEDEEQGQENAVITLEGDDGQSYACQVLDIFDFENKNYALLLNLGDQKEETKDDDKGSIVIMRLMQKDDQSIFQTIEDEEEFDRVVAHVEEMVRQVEAEEGEEAPQ
jgi:uncharacterized protein YrzB (UPF0473 family)